MVTLHLINGASFDFFAEHSKDSFGLAGLLAGEQFDVILQQTNVLFVLLLAPGIVLNLLFGLLGEDRLHITGVTGFRVASFFGKFFSLNKDRHCVFFLFL